MSRFTRTLTLLAALLTSGSATAIRVGVSYDFGGKADGGFNASASTGLKRAQIRLGIQTLEVNPDEKSRTYKIETLARRQADLIIGVGFAQQATIEKTAAKYPRQHFAIIDSVAKGRNVTSVTFREEEGSYLVGYLAGMSSSTGVVGFVGGMDIPLLHKFQTGFTAGVKAANPKATVLAEYVGKTPDAWSNPARAKSIAAGLQGKGADIIYAAAGGSGLGVIDYIREKQCLKAGELPRGLGFISDRFRNVTKSARYQSACAGNTRPMFFIGVDSNQNFMGDFDKNPATLNHGLTSMVKRVDSAVYTMSLWITRKTTYPAELSLGLRESGVGIAVDKYNQPLLQGEVLGQLDSVKQLIISGNIKIPTQ